MAGVDVGHELPEVDPGEALKAYRNINGDIRKLISFFASFQIRGVCNRDELSILQPWGAFFNRRSRNVDDEGFKIYNVANRKDTLFCIATLIGELPGDITQHMDLILPIITLGIGDVDPSVQNWGRAALQALLLHLPDQAIKSFDIILEALLVQCKAPLFRRPVVKQNVAETNRQLAEIVKQDPGSLQVFILLFQRLGDTGSPRSRRFLIHWLVDFICDDMFRSLPVILVGLFNMTMIPNTAARDAWMFFKPMTKAREHIRSFREKVETGNVDHYVSANVCDTLSVVAQIIQKPPSEDAKAEAFKWASVMIKRFPHKVLKHDDFKTVLLQDLDIPEAHFLMGLDIAIKGSDFEAARRHLFKAINHVKEATIAMAIVAIFSEKLEVAESFADIAYTEGWKEVSRMKESVLSTVGQMKEDSTLATFKVKMPACAQSHTTHSQCKLCYMFLCAEEFATLIKN